MAGCVSRDISDLEQFTQDMRARPGGKLEALPEIKPYEAYAYQSAAANLRSPFQLFYQKKQEELDAETQDSGLTEEMEDEIRNRNREELENYELDSIRMVGTMQDGNSNWGIVMDPDGAIHRVKVGNYIGRNIGKILNVFEDKIELREIVKNIQGQWEERQAAIALVEE
jgi:type IV pilus assembly protein PilP